MTERFVYGQENGGNIILNRQIQNILQVIWLMKNVF